MPKFIAHQTPEGDCHFFEVAIGLEDRPLVGELRRLRLDIGIIMVRLRQRLRSYFSLKAFISVKLF